MIITTHYRSFARPGLLLTVGLTMMGTASPAGAQVTAPVALESRAYDRVDELLAAGLGGSVVVGQRPWSRRVVAQIAIAARAALSAGAAAARVPGGTLETPDGGASESRRIDRIVAELESSYADEIAALLGSGRKYRTRIDGASLDVLAVDSPPRGIEDVGLGKTDAIVNPLVQGRGARTFERGVTAGAEVAASQELGRHLAISAHGRLHTASGSVDVRALNATAGARNVVVQVGRVPVLFGQGMMGGLFTSRNAPGLDMVRIGTDRPARLPWILGRLGPAMGTLFVADLGAEQHYPHARMAGWKMSFLPTPRFEMGASLMSIQGGEGAPPAQFGERVIDVLAVVDVLFYQDRDLLFSNKIAGIDLRGRLGRVEVFLDAMADDFDVRRVRSSLWEDSGYNAGVAIGGLGPEGSVRLDAEYQHTGLRFYEHGLFRSGVTVGRQFLGLPLGPRGDAVLGRIRWDPVRDRMAEVTAVVERRSDDRYLVSTTGPDDSGWRFIKSEDRPEEVRARLLLGYTAGRGRTGRLELEGGYERVMAAGFVSGAARNNLLARVGLVFGFH